MTPSRGIRLAVILLVLAGTAGCDQATKHFARTELSLHSTSIAGGLIEFTLAENPGAFLSFGAALPPGVRNTLFTLGVALGLMLLLAYIVRGSKFRWLSFLGLLLVWAGGMSNLYDRFAHHGLVTDFILLRVGPLHTGIFNLADVAIVCGIAVLVVSLRTGAAKSEAQPGSPELTT
jgi:signal peptidase II